MFFPEHFAGRSVISVLYGTPYLFVYGDLLGLLEGPCMAPTARGGPGTLRKRGLVLAGQDPQNPANVPDTVHDDIGLRDDLRRPFVARDTDAQDLLQYALLAQRHKFSEGVEVGGVVADEHGILRIILFDQSADGGTLVSPDGGTGLDDPAANRDPQAEPLALSLYKLLAPLADLWRHVAVVDGGRDALLLDEGALGGKLLLSPALQLLDPLELG